MEISLSLGNGCDPATAAAAFAACVSALVAVLVYREQRSPEVIAYVFPEQALDVPGAVLRIENIGKGGAWRVRLRCSGPIPVPIDREIESRLASFLASETPYLAPGACRETPLGPFGQFIEVMGDRTETLTVSYAARRLGIRRVRGRFPIEAASFRTSMLRDGRESVYEAHR